MSEEELTVEIAEVDGVQINNVYLAVARENEIFKKLASYTTSSDKQDSRLYQPVSRAEQLEAINVTPALS